MVEIIPFRSRLDRRMTDQSNVIPFRSRLDRRMDRLIAQGKCNMADEAMKNIDRILASAGKENCEHPFVELIGYKPMQWKRCRDCFQVLETIHQPGGEPA